MSITRTYSPSAGSVSITDPDLAFSPNIFDVERSGTEYDENFGNRGYVYNINTGTLTWLIPFEEGETVTVWFELGGGPVITCDPVTADFVMPTGVEGIYYLYDVVLGGTAPYALTINSKPAWMEIVILGDHIQFYGTPPTDGVYTVNIEITNCSGGNTLPLLQDIMIYDAPDPVTPGDGDFKISNNALAFTKITGFDATLLIGSFSYTPSSGSLPLSVGSSMVGVFTPFTGFIKITLTNVILGGVSLILKKNGIILQTIVVPSFSNGVKTFNSQTFTDTDLLEIELTS